MSFNNKLEALLNEYEVGTCLVNNNFYTNATAQHNLRGAVRALEALRAAGLEGTVQVATGVTDAELERFREAADRMYFPTDTRLGVDWPRLARRVRMGA